MDAEVYAAAVAELRDVTLAPLANAAAFTPTGDQHVFTLGHSLADEVLDGVALGTWIGRLVDHEAPFESDAPPP
jgi:hypothetical protein